MIAAVAFVPSTPLLIEEISVDADVSIEQLRRASCDAVRAVVGTDPDVVLIVAAAEQSGAFRSPVTASFAGFGVDLNASMPPKAQGAEVPWTVGIALHLLSRVAYSGDVAVVAVAPSGVDLASTLLAAPLKSPRRCALIVVGDGSAGRSVKAPGYVIDGASEFDATVSTALSSGDARALATLDLAEGQRVQSGGVAVWKAIGSVVDQNFDGQLLLNEAPLGVGYFVATWLPVA